MPVNTFIQPSFAKGEIGPALYGRVDTSAYQVALRTARNMIIHPTGGASNRSGLRYLGPVKDHNNPPRLIDFQFKSTDSYVLEFGNLYMRVIRNDAHVVETDKNITAITQANPGVVTSNAHGFSNGDEVYIANVGGMTELNGNRYLVAGVTANTFQLTDQVDGTNIDTTSFGAYTTGGTAARIYTLVTPYLQADLAKLKYVQSADVMTLTHPNYPPKELSRFGHANWTLTDIATGPSITFPTGITITVNVAGAVTTLYRITALKTDTLEESLPGLNNTSRTITAITQANPGVVTSAAHGFLNGDEVYIDAVVGMTQVNGRRFTVANVAANTFELQGENTTSYTAYSSGGAARQTFIRITNGAAASNNTLAWTAVSGAEQYNIYKFNAGNYGIIGNTSATSFLDNNFAANLSQSPPRARNPFQGADNYPGTCSYYEQRRVFGGSNNDPDTSWFSQTGNQSNFNISSPLQDDDAITTALASRQVNEILHYVPMRDLITFTSGAEWTIGAGPDTRLSSDTIKQKPQSEWGSSHRRPITIGSTILFVEPNDRRVRSIGYSFQIDGYTGTSLSILASHLFDQDLITDWCFARTPDPRVYLVMDSGIVTSLTFDQEQEVIAWTRWDTMGVFESTAALRNPSGQVGGEEGVYFVVQRKINNRNVRYIEKVASREFEVVEDAFFVDSGLTYDVPLTITGSTAANPVVLTIPTHGLTTGDQIDISDISWETSFDDLDNEIEPDQLNGTRYSVTVLTPNTVSLQDLEGNNIDGTSFAPYIEGGYARKAVFTISGLENLAGMDVAVLADGNVVGNITVGARSITLPRRASRIHVGLKYFADFETLNIEAGKATIQGRLKSIPKVRLRLQRTRGLFIGPSSDAAAQDQLVEMKQRENELMGSPTELKTGDVDIDLYPEWNSHGRLFIRQRYPLPMTILAVIPDMDIGEG